MIRTLVFALAAAVALSACASTPAPTPSNPTSTPAQPSAESARTLTLERTRCFGFCPDYTVSVREDGFIIYEGRNFVGVTGSQTAQADAADAARLFALADRVNLRALKREYRAHISDIPTFTVTLTSGRTSVSVVDYGGTSVGMPETVRQLEDEIDRVAGSARWTTRPEGAPVTR